MKRIFVIALALMLCVGAFAESDIDWSQYPDDELQNTINELTVMLDGARAELKSRTNVSESSFTIKEGTVLIDTGNITVTVSSAPRIFVDSVVFDAVIENNSDHEIRIDVNEVKVDGWEENGVFGGSVGPGLKSRETCLIDLSGPQTKSVEEIKDCFLRLTVYDYEDGRIYDSGEIEFIYN